MKYKKAKLMSLGLAVVGSMALAGGGSAFADDTNYGIVYEGGVDLQGAVVRDATLEDLSPLINASQNELQVKTSGGWNTGWTRSIIGDTQSCINVKYLKITDDEDHTTTFNSNNIPYIDEIQVNSSGKTVVNGKYIERISFEEVKLDNMSTLLDGKSVAVIAQPRSAGIMLGPIYTDGTCTTLENGIYDPTGLADTTEKGKVFVKTKIQLFENNNGAVGRSFSSDKLYFGFADIDWAQSYKILSPASAFNKGMFSPDPSALQPTDSTSPNKYKSAGDYIYSEYPPLANVENTKARIFVKVDPSDQRDGLKMVFGFGANAGTPTMFYGKIYKVTYKSDPYGAITGITKEEVLSGENPSGTTENASTHYETDYWVADKDVTLENGDTIAKGTHITADQIEKVVVKDSDIEFTVYHKTYTIEYKSDEHGKITGTEEENRNSTEHPGGSTQEADEDYYFSHWICDKDVELIDGTVITAGNPLTDEQIKQVKITQNLVFTAIHKSKPHTPNTGAFTRDGGSVIPVIGMILAALASVGFTGSYIYKHKKGVVKFDR